MASRTSHKKAKRTEVESVDYDGAKPLKNPKYERFCQEAVALNCIHKAYEAVGLKRPRGNANRLAALPNVSKRLAFLWSQAARLAETMAGRHLVKADMIAHANILDFVDVNETGHPRMNLSKVPHELGGAIQEISYDSNGNPRLKLHDAPGLLKFLIERTAPVAKKVELTGKDGGPINVVTQILEEIDAAGWQLPCDAEKAEAAE